MNAVISPMVFTLSLPALSELKTFKAEEVDRFPLPLTFGTDTRTLKLLQMSTRFIVQQRAEQVISAYCNKRSVIWS